MAGKKDAIIRLENVCKVYEMGDTKVTALCEVELNVMRNDFASILGPSGSGKSTLLNMLGLLDLPSDGKIFIDGIETTSLTEKELAHVRGKKIGFIFQMFNLIPSLTVLENVALPAIIYETDEDEANEKARKVLAQMGMEDRINHYPNQLSGGQRQRVAIARALVNDPEIILADEPTGNLDTKTGLEVLDIFKRLYKEGKTIMIVTHDLDITKVTKRTIRIVDGNIQANAK